MQIQRLRYHGSYGIIGQVINVPVDANTMVQQLPRRLDDNYAFNVNIKKNLVHKSRYLSGFVRKSIVKAWLRFLVDQQLYKHYDITVDWTVFDADQETQHGEPECPIECLDAGTVPEFEVHLQDSTPCSGTKISVRISRRSARHADQHHLRRVRRGVVVSTHMLRRASPVQSWGASDSVHDGHERDPLQGSARSHTRPRSIYGGEDAAHSSSGRHLQRVPLRQTDGEHHPQDA
ncbi:unnamed protein product [Ixodes hexagonus]